MSRPLLLLVAALVAVALAAQPTTINITLNAQKVVRPFVHHWEECVGSGHAALMLRQDYRDLLTQAHQELGFKRVRCHGMLDDDMSTYLDSSIYGHNLLSLDNILNNYDFLVSIGMQPYVEVSFMPSAISSGTTTVFHYAANVCPPRSLSEWSELIVNVSTALVQRYGIAEVSQWNFEVWNEPNGGGFWTGTQQQYFDLYNATAHALRSVDPSLRVGGPATAGLGWLTDFTAYFTQNADTVPRPDFIASHLYPTDFDPWTTAALYNGLEDAISQFPGDLPFYLSETNDGLYDFDAPAALRVPMHDKPFASAWAVKNMHDVQGLTALTSFWTFSDIFEEGGFQSGPFFKNQGWGLMNQMGVAKPVYRAFQLLHWAGDQEVLVDPPADIQEPGVGCYGVSNSSNTLLYCYNFGLPNATLNTTTVAATVLGVSPDGVMLYRIDEDNTNAPNCWLDQGSPAYPTAEQVAEQKACSLFNPTSVSLGGDATNGYTFSFDVPAWGVAVFVFANA